jgi:translation initiation factor 1A
MTTHKKRARKSASKASSRESVDDMPVREEGQMYGRVMRMLGNGRLMAACDDGSERMCRIRGSMRKREWVRPGDVVLVAQREYQDSKADVVHKYSDAEVGRLRSMGEDIVKPQIEGDAVDDDVVTFEAQEGDLDWDLV